MSQFNQTQIRNHLLRSLNNNNIAKFPTTSENPRVCKRKSIVFPIYCNCRMIWAESDKNVFGK